MKILRNKKSQDFLFQSSKLFNVFCVLVIELTAYLAEFFESNYSLTLKFSLLLQNKKMSTKTK